MTLSRAIFWMLSKQDGHSYNMSDLAVLDALRT